LTDQRSTSTSVITLLHRPASLFVQTPGFRRHGALARDLPAQLAADPVKIPHGQLSAGIVPEHQVVWHEPFSGAPRRCRTGRLGFSVGDGELGVVHPRLASIDPHPVLQAGRARRGASLIDCGTTVRAGMMGITSAGAYSNVPVFRFSADWLPN
jgi:hypothetical protein